MPFYVARAHPVLVVDSLRHFGGYNWLQIGHLEPGKRAILGQKSARIGFRVGFGGQQVRCRAWVSKRYVHFELQKLIPSWWQPFGGQIRLQTGQLEHGKRAILGQKSARMGCRVGFGGQQVRCRTDVETSWRFVDG